MSKNDVHLAEIRSQVVKIVHDLAAERYERIRMARGPAQDFIKAIHDFRNDGFTIVDLPEDALDELAVHGPTAEDQDWDVDIPLWTKEHGGESGLYLYLRFRPVEGGLDGLVDYIKLD